MHLPELSQSPAAMVGRRQAGSGRGLSLTAMHPTGIAERGDKLPTARKAPERKRALAQRSLCELLFCLHGRAANGAMPWCSRDT